MAFELPPLPYEIEALAPYISGKTLQFHYGKHHRKYVDETNRLTAGTEYANSSLEDIIVRSHQRDQKLFNNAAQAWNHTFFWNCMTPDQGQLPSSVSQALSKAFGGVDEFKSKFSEEGKTLFGSGWVWLVRDGTGGLQIRKGKDAGNPLTEGEAPLFTCDVWEHAYYLDYQNERPKFLENFWKVANWRFLEKNLDTARPNSSHR